MPWRVVSAPVEQHSQRAVMRARRRCLSFRTLLSADVLRQGVRNIKVQFDEAVPVSLARVALCDSAQLGLMGLVTPLQHSLASERLASGSRASSVLAHYACRSYWVGALC